MLKIMNMDAADIRIPRRLYVQSQKRRRRKLARVIMIATGVAGVVCLGLTETSIAFGAAAIPLLTATLILQSMR